MKRALFDQIKDKEVKLHLVYALTVYRSTKRSEVTVAGREFKIPGVGICELNPGRRNGFQCRAPLGHPTALITADINSIPCPRLQEHPDGKVFLGTMAASAYGGISPVQGSLLAMVYVNSRGGDAIPAMCPGTKLDVKVMQDIQRVRGEVEIDGIKLGNYRWDPMYGVGPIGWDPISVRGH